MFLLPTGETVPGDYVQCLERAELVREGTDVTILCYSRMRYTVMQAVTELEKMGYNPEVWWLTRLFTTQYSYLLLLRWWT